MSRRHWLTLLAAVALIHIAVRVPLLWAPWWVDEGASLIPGTQPPRDAVRLIHADYSPPLYFVMLSLWNAALGALGEESAIAPGRATFTPDPSTFGGFTATIQLRAGPALDPNPGITPELCEELRLPPLWAFRLPSLLFSIGVLLGLIGLARAAGVSPAIALGAGLLLAIAPAVARWDTVVRHYSLLSLFTLGLVLALCSFTRERRPHPWAPPALILLTAGALLTHHMAVFFISPLTLWMLVVNGRQHWRRTAASAVALIEGLLLFLLLWGSALATQWHSLNTSGNAGPARADTPLISSWLNGFPLQPALPVRLLVGLDGQSFVQVIFPAWWPWGLTIILLIFAAGYLIRLARGRGTRLDGLLLVWLFAPPALALLVNLWRPHSIPLTWRHFSAAMPAAALLFALGAAELRCLFRPRRATDDAAPRP